MNTKLFEKETAIRLRKEGKTYSEILKVVPVAKSTISLWFKEVSLAKPQVQILTTKKLEACKRGGFAKKQQRIERQKRIIIQVIEEIGALSERELFLIGVSLYWAEGAKEKEWRPGSKLMFSNMDPLMIRVFLRWLKEIAKIPEDMIVCEIYLHETHIHRMNEVLEYWAVVTGFPKDKLSRLYFKRK